jgi:heme a synthase
MTKPEFLPRSLHRYILAVLVCVFLLVIAGGLVTSTQSGLSVPDWPNTYGHFMFAFPLDQMVGGIVFEHTHRMIASVAGMLTIAMAVWLWLKESRPWVRMLGLAAVATVVAQGVLGGITVLFLLPTPISVAHATLAQSYFALIAVIAIVTSRWWHDVSTRSGPERGNRVTVAPAVVASVTVLVQLIIGAWMRHSDAGLAVPDLPLAFGQVFPSLSPEALSDYSRQLADRDIINLGDGGITATQITVHMLHRYWGLLTGIVVTWFALGLRKQTGDTVLRRYSIALPLLILLQITLGVLTILSGKSVLITTAHVVTGAVVLVCCVASAVSIARVRGTNHSVSPQPVFREQAAS